MGELTDLASESEAASEEEEEEEVELEVEVDVEVEVEDLWRFFRLCGWHRGGSSDSGNLGGGGCISP